MKIVWSEYALQKLRELVSYCQSKVGFRKTENIITAIVLRIDDLVNFPYLGQVEQNNHSKYERRYILVYNYKILYEVTKEDIVILDIFHTKQSPQKMYVNEEELVYHVNKDIRKPSL